MCVNAIDLKLYENIFIETNLLSPDNDGVVVLLYSENLIGLPTHIASFIENVAKIDKYVFKNSSVWNCDYVSGGRLILAPTGEINEYHDTKIVREATKKGIARALDAGARKPLLVDPLHHKDVSKLLEQVPLLNGTCGIVPILAALEALYVPIQMRENKNHTSFLRLGFYIEETSESFEKMVRNAIALEKSRIMIRDIAGGDPERMCPEKIVDYVKESFKNDTNITVNVIDDIKTIRAEYPLLSAVSRAANHIDRHKARLVRLEYKPTNESRISNTIILVGKGVTYDTGGADIKIQGKMAGMSRDKGGAATVTGFLKACSILKPTHLKVTGFLCLCRNSVGHESYVSDELIVSRSGKSVRITNTDAEGRVAMADALFQATEIAAKELDPHIYTIATLTGHAAACYGSHTAAMDNHSARETQHANRMQSIGSKLGEGVEVSVVRAEDLAVNLGKCKGDDLVQYDTKATSRNHQLAAGFLIKVGGLEQKNIKYTHLDIAGSSGMPPDEPTAEPILTLCSIHKVFD